MAIKRALPWAFCLLTVFASHPSFGQETFSLDGVCQSVSHVARGRIGEDLTKKSERFYCNSAVVTFFDPARRHVMVTFLAKGSNLFLKVTGKDKPLAFAGTAYDDGINVKLRHVYLVPGEKVQVLEGGCKFEFVGSRMSSMMCGAVVDENGNRTTAVVLFSVTNDPN